MARIPLGRDFQDDEGFRRYAPPKARKPASLTKDKPTSLTADKPTSLTEDKPASLTEDKLSLTEERPHLESAPTPTPTADLPPPDKVLRSTDNALRATAPRMPKGVDGPNIEFPKRLGSQHTREFVVQDLLGDLPEPPNRKRSKLWLFGSLACIVVVAGLGAYGATLINWQDRAPVVPAVAEPPSERVASAPAVNNQPKEIEATPRLIVQDRRAYINEPLLLGLSLTAATGREYIMLKGLGAQIRLSAGQPVDPHGWRLTAFDLRNVFAYSPKDYVGVTSVVVDLHAADDRIIASHVMRLEWVPQILASRGDVAAQPDPPAKLPPSPEIQLKLGPDDTEAFMRTRDARISILARATLRPDTLMQTGTAIQNHPLQTGRAIRF